MKHYQVAIIGGGPAGYTAAEKAGLAKLTTVLFEKNKLGGVCLNEGCIPTKTLLYTAKLLDYTKDGGKYAIVGEEASVDLKKLISRKNKVVRKLVLGVKAKVTQAGVDVVEGEAKILNKNTIECNNEQFTFDNLLICTGSSTFIPPIKGIDNIEYWTHAEALDAKELPESITIVGGGVIGMEFASYFNSLGSKITVIEMMEEILPPFDQESATYLREEYTKKGITFLLSTKVEEFTNKDNKTHILVNKEGNEETIVTDKVLLSVGRRANTTGFGLEKLGLTTDERGRTIINEKLQSSMPNVYVCGDANGTSLLAHTAIREAEVAINTICNVNDSMEYNAISSIVYSNPEIAGVGETEESLKRREIPYEKKVIPMSYSGRFVAENENINGMAKILYHKVSKEILGVHIVGNPASEFIVLAAMAIAHKMTLSELNKLIFPHPTVGEIIKELL